MAKPKRPRSARRVHQRAAEKLARDRARLARLEAGGTPERPLQVETASVIETRAESQPCLYCLGPARVTEHRAESRGERRLRVVVTRCARCGHERTFYFTIRLPS